MNKINLSKLNVLKEKSKVIPIFFACDDAYIKYLCVTLRSLISHATISHDYRIYIMGTDISEESIKKVKRMETVNVFVEFCDVTDELEKIKKKLAVRDYYSMTTYYRIFIADMYPQYNKVLYVDSDTIFMRDAAELYHYNLGNNFVGAVQDYVVDHTDIFGEYVENVLGISRSAYFNAGVLLINSHQFRNHHMKKQFMELLNTYTFVVAQDQDYLNILCKGNILWIDSRWNVQMSEKELRPLNKIGIIHYNFAKKPWHTKECKYSDQFWKSAEKTEDYGLLVELLNNYSVNDEKKDLQAGDNLKNLAEAEISNEKNYFHLYLENDPRSITRQEVLEKIKQYEIEGRFDEDVEEDPPGRMLMPDEIDYLDNSIRKKLQTRYAFKLAKWFVKTLMRKKQFVIKDYVGIENYKNLDSGAIITCNHFNAFDSFAMHLTYEKSGQYRRKLYRIIKEANYTSFPGFYGFLMRNCNTIPLSSNRATMKKFMKAVDKRLQDGNFVLIYPEQSMWWNYRKPKPLKRGGFIFAVRNNVPVLPCFVTMSDLNVPGEGGFPVQEYTVHIGKPIYPDTTKSKNDAVREMMEKNFEVWKEIYESTYGIPLTYETKVKPSEEAASEEEN